MTVLRSLLSLLITAAVVTLSSASLAEGTPTAPTFSALGGPATPGPASREAGTGGRGSGAERASPSADAEERVVTEAVRRITERFGPIPVPFQVNLLTDAKFDAVARYWFPEKYEHVDGLSVISTDGVNQVYVRGEAPTASVTVAHELFHLIWCARVDCNAVPLWLTEGAAIAFSEGYAEEAPDGRLPSPPAAAPSWWHRTAGGFAGIGHAGNPHAVGRQVMARLAWTAGPAAVARFLELVARDGADWEEAWQRAFGFPVEELGTKL